jgi:hypothetical protein
MVWGVVVWPPTGCAAGGVMLFQTFPRRDRFPFKRSL